MKIICMDCQTESRVDMEEMRAQPSIECQHCAEDFRMSVASETERGIMLAADLDADMEVAVDYDSTQEQSAEFALFEHEGVLEEDSPEDALDLSAIPYPPAAYCEQGDVDEVISLVPDVAEQVVVEETSFFASQHADQTLEEITQPLPQLDVEYQPSMREAAAETQSAEEKIPPVPVEPKRKGMAVFSAPKLVFISAIFVSLTVAAGMMNFSSSKANPKAGNSVQSAAHPAKQEVKQNVASAPAVAVTAPSEPAPSPSVPQETTAADKMTAPVNQPVADQKPTAPPATDKPAATEAGSFTVQVGSHNQLDLADNQMAKLKAFGYEPRVVSVEIPNRGKWHRVQVGSFADRKEAQAFGAELVSKGVVETFVVAGR